jgi:hypothetical protein
MSVEKKKLIPDDFAGVECGSAKQVHPITGGNINSSAEMVA